MVVGAHATHAHRKVMPKRRTLHIAWRVKVDSSAPQQTRNLPQKAQIFVRESRYQYDVEICVSKSHTTSHS